MRARLLSVLTAAAALVVAAPASADWPALSGTTTIEGSKTGYTLLRVAQPITLDWGDLEFDVEGKGRLYGAVLREQAPGKKQPFMAYQFDSDRYEGLEHEEF